MTDSDSGRPAEPTFQPPPEIGLQQLEDISPPESHTGFLWLSRARFRTVYRGQPGRTFVYDQVHRRALDAAVIAAHYGDAGQRYVYLRSALRPPLEGTDVGPSLWELPAGLIEPEEAAADPARSCVVREAEEELGFALSPEQFEILGPAVFPAPGMVAERQYFFEVQVNPTQRGRPQLDGSPLEEHGRVISVPLGVALGWCSEGLLPDSKTELGLRRLADRWGVRE